MKLLLIGGGGREHALAWKAIQSKHVNTLFVAPGNAGTALLPKTKNIDIQATDIPALLAFAQSNAIDLTLVGPEAPLVEGIVDKFAQANLAIFGPTQACAELEGSKAFAKQFMIDNNIPTADYAEFIDPNKAKQFLPSLHYPIVLKADGLAAGKGVIIAQSIQQAEDAIEQFIEANLFGHTNQKIIIEEFLSGEELSYIVMIDGMHILPMASSQDHKKRDEGDKGPNTGGMGAISPAPNMTPALEQQILQEVMQPVLAGLKKRGLTYQGFLYAGLMITHEGPKVLEFNCRFGDPETQPILMRLQSDLVELIQAALQGKLNECEARWDSRVATGVVLAAGGYPGTYTKGHVISGLDTSGNNEQFVFHAGTKQENQDITTQGGRVLCVTSLGQNYQDALTKTYQRVSGIHWQDMFYRKDIGLHAMPSGNAS